jgi:alpha-L-rhamnosidase
MSDRRLLISLVLALFAGRASAAAISPVGVADLTCEHERDPVGIGATAPRLSWKLRSDRTGEVQTAYQVRAGSSPDALSAGSPDLWDSGKVVSDQSVLVPWAGEPLGSRSRVFWEVRIWDKDGSPTAWSPAARFELGLLSPSDWKGLWITSDLGRVAVIPPNLAGASWIAAAGAPDRPRATVFRHELTLPAGARARSAVIEISTEGGFTFYVNGRQARQAAGRPGGWRSPVRGDFGVYLTPGVNELAIEVNAGGRDAAIAKIDIETDGGSRFELATDGSWRAGRLDTAAWRDPAVERFLATGSASGAPAIAWAGADFDDSGWAPAKVLGEYGIAPWGPFETDTTSGPGRYLRRDFEVRGRVVRARLYATALGVYRASINGRRVGDSELDPGWTDYRKRVMVQTYDVTDLLVGGRNTVGAVLADGWYAGRLGWMGLAQYGDHPAFDAQLEIMYSDGSTETIATDGSWQAGRGELVASDQQWGDIVDATREEPGWDRPEGRELGWPAAAVEAHGVELDPQLGPPVRALLERTPKRIERRGDTWIVDLGQNMVGHVRIRAHGPAGTRITLRHGEMLNADGSLYTANLRPARATDVLVLRGSDGMETLEPVFTFHGFRYVEVSGYPGTLTAGDIRGIVVGSDTPPTGSFSSSNPDLNRLYENIVWGQRGNFLSVPTDCPQRDERMGWMGDAEVFAPTAARNADVAAFFGKWLVDVDGAQGPEGDFSNYSPRVNAPQPGMAAWGDAGNIIPWAMYAAYGDTDFLSRNYPNMVRWVEYCRRNSTGLLRPKGGVGDHLNPGVVTPTDLVATAYFAESTRIVARSAAVLGREADAAAYGKLFRDIASAFTRAYVSPDGTVEGDTQTGYLLALQFDLLPEGLRRAAERKLAENVERVGHLTTGFIGVGLICPTLTDIGRSDLAWKLVLNDQYPSWLFSVRNGATTIWERWDGWTPDRGFEDPAMNSFNHYSLGSVGAWLYSGAAGIRLDPDHPGYKRFILAPQFTDRLDFLSASVDSPYGVISASWRKDGGNWTYSVTVPPNTSATLVLPGPEGKPGRTLPAGRYVFTVPRAASE